MTGQLTGYEETSVVEVGAVLDTAPSTPEEVYLRTMAYSERAIAAVAAKRAGTAGANFNGGTITGGLEVDVAAEAPALTAGTTIVEGSGATTVQTNNAGDYSLQVFDDTGNLAIEVGPGALALLLCSQINVPSGSNLTINKSGGGLLMQLSDNGYLTYIDGGGNPCFQVQPDGSVHIKTGTTIQADL